MSAREFISYVYNDILVKLTILQHPSVSHINYTYSVENNAFILIQIVPLHVCYLFRPVLRPSPGMSIQISFKGRYNKI